MIGVEKRRSVHSIIVLKINASSMYVGYMQEDEYDCHASTNYAAHPPLVETNEKVTVLRGDAAAAWRPRRKPPRARSLLRSGF